MSARPPVWVSKLATRFWAEAADDPPFPRDLRPVVCCTTDLNVIEVPHLSAASAATHFAALGIPFPKLANERRLHGCFGSYRNQAAILIDPLDLVDELRFTFAHELAHYLRDYRAARADAVARLGLAILEVLDGDRPPTPQEQIAGELRGRPIGAHAHFLERDRWGNVVSDEVREAEDAADRLAFELLAPFAAVKANGFSDAALMDRLTTVFGLPGSAAAKYATILLG